jgi:hypothetical protein
MEQRVLGRPGRPVSVVGLGTWQAEQNAAAAGLPPLPQASLDAIEGLYDKYFRATVHDRW